MTKNGLTKDELRPEEFTHKQTTSAMPEKLMDNQQDANPGIDTSGRLPVGQRFGNELNPIVPADEAAYGDEKHVQWVQDVKESEA